MQAHAVASSDELKQTLNLLNGEVVSLQKQEEKVSSPLENQLCIEYRQGIKKLKAQYRRGGSKKYRRKIKRALRKKGRKFRKCGCD